MGTRDRSRYTFYPNPGFSSGNFYTTERCIDVVGNRKGDNPLSITKDTIEGGGFRDQYGQSYIFNMPGLRHGVVNNEPDFSTYNNRIISQTGPLTPKLYLPVSVFELRDIPAMLKHAGDLLHKLTHLHRVPTGKLKLDPLAEGASATLAYQFGWAPLIQDIGRLCDFADVVRKRQYTLLRAHSSRGVKRKITLLDDSPESVPGGKSLISTYSGLVYSRFTVLNTHKRWATIRWTVRDQSQIGKVPTFNEAFRISYGLNKGYIPIEIWKALPWSWAIDWFADISNVLQANHNMIYYKPSNMCRMSHYKTTYTWEPAKSKDGKVVFDGGKVISESKQRSVVAYPSPSLSLKLPFLDSFKLSILGSMSILRIKRFGK